MARDHTAYILKNGKGVNHDNWDKRSEKAMKEKGYKRMGENAAGNQHKDKKVAAEGMIKQFINSPIHNKVMHNANYDRVGMAIVRDDKRKRQYAT